MILSTLSATVKSAVILFVFNICLAFTFAAPIDPTATIALSFFTANNEPIPNANATVNINGNTCTQIPALASSFSSNSNQSNFALFQDVSCQSYLYSVEVSIGNLHGAMSLLWVNNGPDQSHAPGVQFTDPQFSSEQSKDTKRARLIQIVMISVTIVSFIIILGIFLCYMDSKRNLRRGFVPEPTSPKGHSTKAEAPKLNRSIYQYNGHHRSTSSVSSSVTYLPPYISDSYEKSGATPVTLPEEARTVNSPNEKRTGRYELPTTRSMSFSNLTNQIGTGAGLEPGSVQQGRNEGFGYGLGYDIEDSWKQDSRRSSAIILRNAVMTSPHSPQLRPSSVLSDDFGQVAGREGVMIDSREIYMSA